MGAAAGIDLHAPANSAPALIGAVVVVIDDMPANVLLMQRLLTRAGASRVIGVTDPRQAVDAYLEAQPDLILLDLHMPHMDGLAVFEAIKANSPVDTFVPVIVLTADSGVDAKNRALAAGAKDFLTKPFEHTEVLLRVNNLLETRSLHLALQRHNQELQQEIARRAADEQRLATERALRENRVRRVLDGDGLTMVFQPIADLATGQVAGVEALARFDGVPHRPPNEWFADASDLGLGPELELYAIQTAVAALDRLPSHAYMSINVSPTTALDPRLGAAIEPAADRLVVELTEHAQVNEYQTLLTAMATFREMGVRVAVDDAGAGYSSFQHILRLRPDIIKLDIELTRGINHDPARRALGVALVQFARDIQAAVTAEGIETESELETLRNIDVEFGQGYLLGRPAPLP
jgi:EAL domain-containing protein (putative c-di-GMP-specific phosphodiesterase class I)